MGGWKDDDCSVEGCAHDCNGHGDCIKTLYNGTYKHACSCHKGWAKDDCSLEAACPWEEGVGMCSGRGKCRNGTCLCVSIYRGANCELRSCPGSSGKQTCSGHGSCGGDGACLCDAGWSHEDCSYELCPSNCSFPQGSCVNSAACKCAPGFGGRDCAHELGCPNDCMNSLGRGTCSRGECVCEGDWYGHGKCNNGTCVCSGGYGGAFSPNCAEKA